MITNEYVLELSNVFHTGNVEPGTCFQKLVGSVPTGIILKDVSLEVHGGEVMAILGSKGKDQFQMHLFEVRDSTCRITLGFVNYLKVVERRLCSM